MKTILLAAALVAQPIVSDDILEPSVRNEVDHALGLAARHLAAADVSATNAVAEVSLPFPTNGLSATEIAIRLVSSQRADGGWLAGTNDVTRMVVELLESLP